MAKKEKILIIRNSALGDVAMTLPVLYSAARQYPDVDFYLLTRPFFAQIFINSPGNLHIIEADYQGMHRGIKGIRRLIQELGEYKFDAVADLHNVLRSWVITTSMRLGGKRVAMVDKMRRKRLGKSLKAEQKSFIQRYADTLEAVGYPVKLDFTSIYEGVGTPTAPMEVTHPAVGIAPFARYLNKTYPTDLMERVVKMLTQKGINVYLFGARGAEAQQMQQWADKYPHCTSVAGKMPIADELAMMSHMDLMVTMDSANQHLASIVGTRVISIWGSTTPQCGFYGYRQDRDDALFLGLECQPCTVAGSEACKLGTDACLRLLTPTKIATRIIDILKKR